MRRAKRARDKGGIVRGGALTAEEMSRIIAAERTARGEILVNVPTLGKVWVKKPVEEGTTNIVSYGNWKVGVRLRGGKIVVRKWMVKGRERK